MLEYRLVFTKIFHRWKKIPQKHWEQINALTENFS